MRRRNGREFHSRRRHYFCSTMKFTAICAALIVALGNASPAMNADIVNFVNNANAGWKAHVSPRFVDATLEEVRTLCGTIMPDEPGYFALPEREEGLTGDEIPTEFDARSNWPNCPSIGHIRDQSSCGSCWAFASTEALTDRTCIATGDDISLSAEDTTACCGMFACASFGCDGGQPSGAWNWFKRTGVVTGGDYPDIGKEDTCMPYSMIECNHHTDSTVYPPCPNPDYKTPKCTKTCSETSYGTDYKSDKHHAKSAYSLGSVAKIQHDIMTYGPATAAFTVYEDFPTYQSGVYTHVKGSSLGGHAIKIYGWGVEDGVDYWLVANSWNPSWGDNGSFKIKRGTNECGIEGQVVAGQV